MAALTVFKGTIGETPGAVDVDYQNEIRMWYGALANIPAGWQICDGTGGTPDLRGYFVKGAAAGNAGDDAAHGNLTHTHDNDVSVQTGIASPTGAGASRTSGHNHIVTIDPANHEPPYKHLVFIMKL